MAALFRTPKVVTQAPPPAVTRADAVQETLDERRRLAGRRGRLENMLFGRRPRGRGVGADGAAGVLGAGSGVGAGGAGSSGAGYGGAGGGSGGGGGNGPGGGFAAIS